MGYYTSYELRIDPPERTDEVAAYVEAQGLTDDLYGLDWFRAADGFVPTYDAVKWYGHQEDMVHLSRAFPLVTFVLSGDGEEQGDVWRKRFRNGKVDVQTAPPVVWPDWED
jgi:hypothetical protein